MTTWYGRHLHRDCNRNIFQNLFYYLSFRATKVRPLRERISQVRLQLLLSPKPNLVRVSDSPPSCPLRRDSQFHVTTRRCNILRDKSVLREQVSPWMVRRWDQEHRHQTINESRVQILLLKLKYRSVPIGIYSFESHFNYFPNTIFVDVIHGISSDIVVSENLLFFRIHVS